jgi:hypothetical protein
MTLGTNCHPERSALMGIYLPKAGQGAQSKNLSSCNTGSRIR